MKFEIAAERLYPHPIERVWKALTTPEAIAAWLMESDFKPHVRHVFTMCCENDQGGEDVFECEVLEIQPPTRMLWSWLPAGEAAFARSYVEFRAESSPEGTLLRIRHYGDADPPLIEVFESGWPQRLEDIARLLSDSD